MWQVWFMYLDTLFCMWIFSGLHIVCWKSILSPLNGLGTLVEKSVEHKAESYYLGSQFYSIDLYVYLYGRTTLSWIPKHTMVSFKIKKCESSHFFRIICPCISLKILGSVCQFLLNSLEFQCGLHWSCRSVLGIVAS